MKSRIALIAPTFRVAPDDVRLAIYEAVAEGQHLYFIKGRNMVKIGIAHNPLRRFSNFQVGSPVKLELIYVVPFGGEWFKYDKVIRDFIKEVIKICKQAGLEWNLQKNKPEEASSLETEKLPSQLAANLLRISGKTPPNKTSSWNYG